MHIAIAAFGSRGDIQPMLALAMGFRQAGHTVVLCAPPDFAGWIGEWDIPFLPVGSDMQAWMDENAKLVAHQPLKALKTMVDGLHQELENQFDCLGEPIASADLVIGAGAQIAAPALARRAGVPYHYIAYCPRMLPSPHHPPVMVPWHRDTPWLNRIGWRLADAMWDLTLKKRLNRRLTGLGLPLARHLWAFTLDEAPILAADSDLAPLPPDLSPRIFQPGAFWLPAQGQLPAELEEFLQAGYPPVYVGFGSMADQDPRATMAMLGQAVEQAGVRALVAKGWAGLAADQLPDSVRLLDPVPHELLFPRLAAAVHHGGAGTTTAVARSGIPQLVVPHMLDQYYFADRVFRLGLGPKPIPRGRLDADRLAAALTALTQGDFAEPARQIGQRISGKDAVGQMVAHVTGHYA